MFYRLTHINDVPLPASVPMDGRAIPVAGGGLLLEPPTTDGSHLHPDGHSILWLHGEPASDGRPDLVIHSSEAYRWREANQLDISRPQGAPCLRLHGLRDGATLNLETEPAPAAIGRTRLTFVEAGDEPIPAHWSRTLHSQSMVIRRGPPITDPVVLRMIAAHQAAEDERRLARAAERLARAWRAEA